MMMMNVDFVQFSNDNDDDHHHHFTFFSQFFQKFKKNIPNPLWLIFPFHDQSMTNHQILDPTGPIMVVPHVVQLILYQHKIGKNFLLYVLLHYLLR